MILLLIYLAVAIGFSFYCSVAEAVLLSITPSFIATLRKKNEIAAEKLAGLKSNIDRPLAAILSLNTIAHTIGAAGVGAQAAKLYPQNENVVALASGVMTLLILIFSEIIPKTVGALYWRTLGPTVATTVRWLIVLLYPLVWISEQLTKLLSGGKAGHQLTREELTAMADIGVQHGVLGDRESRIYRALMAMPTLRAEDIMTPRVVIVALQKDQTVGDAIPTVQTMPVSRVPIYGEKLDDVAGFALKVDLLLAHARGESDRKLEEFSRPITAIADETPLPTVLDTLSEGKQHVAMVVDRYGSVTGLITLEDVIETLLDAEIVDEMDKQVDLQEFARKKWQRRAEKTGLKVEGEITH